MPKKVFVDSVAWIALINKSDNFHERSNEVKRQLENDKCKLITTEFVLLEVANELSSPPTRDRAIRYINGLKHLSNLTIIEANNELFQLGWLLYSKRLDKEWSLTDCISFVIMQRDGMTQAFTNDHHFEQAGFIKLIKEV